VADAQQDVYLPVRALCVFLGISNSQKQVTQLQGDRVLRKYLRKFYIHTSGGRQPSWCLNLRAVAFWLAKVDIDVVRTELQDGLIDWQEALMAAANTLFWGGEPGQDEELDPRELRQRMARQDMEIRRLKLQVRTHARRLAAIEKHTLPPGTYFDLPDEPDE
jgi:hypothetical protein